MDKVILVRYGEIGLKSSPVRRQFEKKLISNIRSALERNGVKGFRVYRQGGRIFLNPNENEYTKVLRLLPRVFGITSISPAVRCDTDLEEIQDAILGSLKNKLSNKISIAIKARRAWKGFPYSSEDLGRILGQALVDKFDCNVDLVNPSIEIFVEIRKYTSFVFFERITGMGGMPYGTAGRILALLENRGSALAAWMMMRRGCEVIPVWWEKTKIEFMGTLKSWERVPEGHVRTDGDIIGFLRGIIKEKKLLGVVLGDREIKKCDFEFDSKFDIPIYRPLLGLTNDQISKEEKIFLS